MGSYGGLAAGSGKIKTTRPRRVSGLRTVCVGTSGHMGTRAHSPEGKRIFNKKLLETGGDASSK